MPIDITADALHRRIMQLLPRGPIWPRYEHDNVMTKLMRGIAEEPATVCAAGKDLRENTPQYGWLDPSSALFGKPDTLLPDWEELLSVSATGLTDDERRAQVKDKLRARGAVDIPTLEALGAAKWNVTEITQGFLAASCVSPCTAPLHQDGPFVALYGYGDDTGEDVAGIWSGGAGGTLAEFPDGAFTAVAEPFEEEWTNHSRKFLSTSGGASSFDFEPEEPLKPVTVGTQVRVSGYAWGQDGAGGTTIDVLLQTDSNQQALGSFVVPDQDWVRFEYVGTIPIGANSRVRFGFSFAASSILAIYNVRFHPVDTELEAAIESRMPLHTRALFRPYKDIYLTGSGYT